MRILTTKAFQAAGALLGYQTRLETVWATQSQFKYRAHLFKVKMAGATIGGACGIPYGRTHTTGEEGAHIVCTSCAHVVGIVAL